MSELYKALKGKLKVCKLTGDQKEINIRCPFCKDSVHDPYKGHFYIQNHAPYKYFCQRCQSSGIVNSELLEMLSCDDYALINNMQREYTEYKRKVRIKYGETLSFLSKRRIIYPLVKTTQLNKREYINDRLGINITDEDSYKYKIIYSLNDFMKQNGLEKLLNKKFNDELEQYKFNKKIENLEKNCVGFLSSDKSTIVFRSLDKEKAGFRYSNFTIFPEIDSKKTYTISNNLDLNNDTFNIHISEGIFDIIGVYNHVQNSNMNSNDLFIANAGKSYCVTANFIKKLSILNANINIYSDSDVDVKFYKDMLRLEPLFKLNGINIYYNNKGKDFGVSKDKIFLSTKIEL